MTAPAPPEAGAPDPGAERIRQWLADLVSGWGPNTLLWSDDGVVLDITHSHPGGLAKLLAGKDTRLSELYREPAAQERALARARIIRAKDLELDREHGMPGCALAIGAARWTERRGPTPNAPVFLRRCELLPTDPTLSEFDVVVRDDLQFNPVLRRFLEGAGGADIPFAALVRSAMRSSGFDPSAAYETLRRWPGPPGWTVIPDMWITTFPHAKLAAVTDAHRVAASAHEHPVLGPIAAGARAPRAPASVHVPDDPDLVTVLDADPGQVAVLEALRSGRSVVVDAGPGTGKSQTIVNAVADLARSARSSLVIAGATDTRAAIAGRLAHVGLGELLTQPGSPTPLPATVPAIRQAQRQAEWTSAGKELAEHVERLHTVRQPWGMSLHQIQERLAAVCESADPPRSKVRLTRPVVELLTPDRLAHWTTRLETVARDGAWVGPDDPADPWWGASIADDTARDKAGEAAQALGENAIQDFDRAFHDIFQGVTVPPLASLSDYGEFIGGMQRISRVLGTYRLGVFDAPLEEWTATSTKGALDRWRHSRAIKGLLRPGAGEGATSLLHEALAARSLWQSVRGSEVMPGQVRDLDRAQTAYDVLAGHARFLGDRLPGRPDLAALPLPRLHERMAQLSASQDRLAVLASVTSDLEGARSVGLGDVVVDFASRHLTPEQVRTEIEFVWLASVLAACTNVEPAYARVDGEAQRAARTRFRQVDRALQAGLAAGIANERLGQAPLVWLCPPAGVGVHVDPGAEFDLVVVADAQSITAGETMAALARGRQALIVGDSRLPGPSPVMATAGGTPAQAGAGASLLDEAAAVLPVFRFAWHYRCRDERLIARQAAGPYAGEFRTFPAPRDTGAWQVMSSAAIGDDDALTTAAVEAIRTHARTRPEESLVVVTLGPWLADTIRSALARSVNPAEFDFCAEQGDEPLVVVPAHRAAAVVRDAAIVVLEGSAPAELAGASGLRLLTAAVTRARRRCLLVQALDPDTLTVPTGGAPGAVHRDGRALLADLLSEWVPPTTSPTSVLTADLTRRLTGRGLSVRTDVLPGVVDLALRDPAVPLAAGLAVQLDGPAYAALGGVRMRERVVPEQLRRLGWRALKILSVDLFRDPAREEARILGALARLAEGEEHTGPIGGAARRRASRPSMGDSAASESAAGTVRRSAGAALSEAASPAHEPAHDRWLRENRPPHWD